MPNVSAGAVERVYCPLSGVVSVTPGTAGAAIVRVENAAGNDSFAQQRITAAQSFNVAAGETLYVEAIGQTASYTTSGTDSGAAALYATLALTATSSGKRQALGSTRQVKFTAAAAGSIYVKFTNASAAIAVSSSDTTVDCNASSAVTLNVPSGYAFLEYLRVGGSDVNFNLGLMV